MPYFMQHSRATAACAALRASLAGTKCDSTIAIRSLFQSLLIPARSNALIEIGAVTSLAMARSTLAIINSPGCTDFFSECAAKIFCIAVWPINLVLLFTSPSPFSGLRAEGRYGPQAGEGGGEGSIKVPLPSLSREGR